MWYVVYKLHSSVESVRQQLSLHGVECFYPMIKSTVYDANANRMVEQDKPLVSNLIFLHETDDILSLIDSVTGLGSPMKDNATGKAAVVSDDEMQRFMKVVEYHNNGAKILNDPFAKFEGNPRVRVKAGHLEGMEGRVVRIKRDRTLVISLGTMAIAVTGIHHSLLEVIDNE